MVSKISGINQTTQTQTQTNQKKKLMKNAEKCQNSIFDQSTKETSQSRHHNRHQKGLGAGQIPPGIQKKIDSGNVPQSLIDKFKQIAEALKAKEAPVETVPSTEVVPAQEFVPDAALAQQVAAEIALAQELLG